VNSFQQRCSKSIGEVVSRHLLRIALEEYPATQPADGVEGADAMFLRGDLIHGERHYKIYVYPEGAGANVGCNWYVLQAQDYETEEALIQTFCEFLGKCLDGSHPVTALEAVQASRR
jgi:hypothetical protein